MKKELMLRKVVLIAMFSALACAATFVQIRMPAGDFVHLGNFVMIIAALLLGGIEGGIVGSLGMGIYDIIFYTQKPSTIIRTFVLKFIIGFLAGYLFRLILKKKFNVRVLLGVLSGIFLAIFVVSLVFFVKGDFSSFSFSSGLNSKYSFHMLGQDKTISISLYIPIFSFIFSVGLLLATIFSFKLSERSRAALFALTLAVLVNIIGEFLLRWLLEGLMVDGFKVSIVTATSKIPGSLITGFITVLLSALVYEPIYRNLKNVDYFNDDTADFDSLETVAVDSKDNNLEDGKNISE